MVIRKFFLVIAVLLLLLPLVQAQDEKYPYSIMFLNIKDAISDEPIRQIPLAITFKDLDIGVESSVTRFLDNTSSLRIELTPSQWQIIIKADNQKSPEIDYYGNEVILVEDTSFVINKTVYLHPVGKIEGNVVDYEDNLVNEADLKLSCKTDLEDFPIKTDRFGSFSAIAPLGKCTISAAYEDLVGNIEVNVNQGSYNKVSIELTRSLKSRTKQGLYYLLLILPFLIIVYFVYTKIIKPRGSNKAPEAKVKKKKVKKMTPAKEEVSNMSVHYEQPVETMMQEEANAEEQTSSNLNPRARDIMQTLNEREVAIVTHLLDNNHKSTQATIRSATGIPKTSLSRSFQSLEDKKVINVDKVGKLKKVQLTGWFLGNE